MERDWGRVAIRPTISRSPEPEFPKIAAETAGETGVETRRAGGSARATAAEIASFREFGLRDLRQE